MTRGLEAIKDDFRYGDQGYAFRELLDLVARLEAENVLLRASQAEREDDTRQRLLDEAAGIKPVPWYPEFCDRTLGLCVLCGNSGYFDTRGRAFSPAGVDAGATGPCICPNGRAKSR